MAEVLVLEFDAEPADYEKVNELLGIDPASGSGEWPDGLVDHVGAKGEGRRLMVVEVWESRDAQAAFMHSRLGPALGEAGLPDPKRVEWLGLLGHHGG